jgi:hypothetical protein
MFFESGKDCVDSSVCKQNCFILEILNFNGSLAKSFFQFMKKGLKSSMRKTPNSKVLVRILKL